MTIAIGNTFTYYLISECKGRIAVNATVITISFSHYLNGLFTSILLGYEDLECNKHEILLITPNN